MKTPRHPSGASHLDLPGLASVGLAGQLAVRSVNKIFIRTSARPPSATPSSAPTSASRRASRFARPAADEDVKSLYATGYFFKIRVDVKTTPPTAWI